MGLLVEGKWQDTWYDTASTLGRFERKESQFRNWVTADGSPGPTGKGGFRAEPHRYHLYVSYACPWAHRTMIVRSLKGLQEIITLSVVHWYMREDGWSFAEGDGVIGDTINRADFLHQVYTTADSQYTGRVTVPVLWDKKENTIVSNESSEIIRMFNSAFDEVSAKPGDFYPTARRAEIDAVNARVYRDVNNGVYRAGFATSQEAYDEALVELFKTLDWLEDRLSQSRFVVGNEVTEADWRLFTTLVRFDPVYVGHFKCNRKRIVDYPNLSNYVRDLFQHPGIAETVRFDHIKAHYYASHTTINPTGIVPAGPELNYTASHDRNRF